MKRSDIRLLGATPADKSDKILACPSLFPFELLELTELYQELNSPSWFDNRQFAFERNPIVEKMPPEFEILEAV
jgi:hypothetical protein